MKAGLKYFLRGNDGTCSRLVDDPNELIEACEASGRLGEIYATYVAPQLFARIKGVLELADASDSSGEPSAPGDAKPEASGADSAVPEKTRRTARPVKANKVSGPAGIQQGESADSKS